MEDQWLTAKTPCENVSLFLVKGLQDDLTDCYPNGLSLGLPLSPSTYCNPCEDLLHPSPCSHHHSDKLLNSSQPTALAEMKNFPDALQRWHHSFYRLAEAESFIIKVLSLIGCFFRVIFYQIHQHPVTFKVLISNWVHFCSLSNLRPIASLMAPALFFPTSMLQHHYLDFIEGCKALPNCHCLVIGHP